MNIVREFIFYSRINKVNIDNETLNLYIHIYNSPNIFTIKIEEDDIYTKLHELNICKNEKHQMIWRFRMGDQEHRKTINDPIILASFPTHRDLVPWTSRCNHDKSINCKKCNEKTSKFRWCDTCSKHTYLLCDHCITPICYECMKTHNECIYKKNQ